MGEESAFRLAEGVQIPLQHFPHPPLIILIAVTNDPLVHKGTSHSAPVQAELVSAGSGFRRQRFPLFDLLFQFGDQCAVRVHRLPHLMSRIR